MRKRRGNHTKAHEGTPNRIYGDPKGIPTLGSGYAVLGDDGKYRLRPWNEIGRAIDPSKPYTFTAQVSRAVHVRADARDGGRVKAAAYDRAAPGA